MRRAAPAVVSALVAVVALAGCDRSEEGRSPAPRPDPAGVLEPRWRWVAPPPSYVGMPGADGDGVAVTFGHSHVTLLDPAGRARWTFDGRGLRDVAPRLTADAVLVPTEDGLLAIDRATGALRWQARTGERTNTPVVAGDRAVATTWEGSLVAFDLASGRVAWRAPLPGVAHGPA
ncbi:MAG TPA: PQQ-binding-like beta-propeller repeat protein, partial [Acidimicrobiales bacterium]|nr:PQQ-binding-like beta-propeller repeat protein [Acidimicrobiales bacterium]